MILLTIESLYSLLHSSNLGPSWLTIPVLVILVMNSRCKTVLYTDGHDGYPLDSAMKDDILSKSVNGPAPKAVSCYSIGESLILFSSSLLQCDDFYPCTFFDVVSLLHWQL